MPDALIPGQVDVPGRRFLYIQDEDPLTFPARFDQIASGAEPGALPAAGGMISENTTITTPHGEHFCGVSFKGDLEGWERAIEAYARARALKLLRVSGVRVSISDGKAWPISSCTLGTYEPRRQRRRNRSHSAG